jgi:hypothetical protein
MMATQNGKVAPQVVAHSMTDSLLASLMDQTDLLHKQIYQLTEKLTLVIADDNARLSPAEDPSIPVACRLHERLVTLQEHIASVSRHLNSLTERVML